MTRSTASGLAKPARAALGDHLALPLGVVVALVWANSRPESYFSVAHALSFGINDIGMALFFALVTNEVVDATVAGGSLHAWRRVMFAIVAAAGAVGGGIAAYVGYLHFGDEGSVLARGWPIMCATDIAFSYWIARIICRPAAVPFLLLVAIVGDTIGLMIVEVRYPLADGHPEAIFLVVVAIAAAIVLRGCHVASYWPYVFVCGVLSWLGLFWSGLHPALALVPVVALLPRAGRARGLLVGARTGARDAPSRFERAWKSPARVVLFAFGIVNAGVVIRGVGTGTWAILVASLAGKPVGMLLALVIAVAAGLRLPHQLGWRDIIVSAFISSMGFTFALFFATATFPVGPPRTEAKIGALFTIAAVLVAVGAAKLLDVGPFADAARRRRKNRGGAVADVDRTAVAAL